MHREGRAGVWHLAVASENRSPTRSHVLRLAQTPASRRRRRTCKTREEARHDVLDYIEMFYNPVRKPVRNGMLSSAEFERQQILKAEGVRKSRGYPLLSGQGASVNM